MWSASEKRKGAGLPHKPDPNRPLAWPAPKFHSFSEGTPVNCQHTTPRGRAFGCKLIATERRLGDIYFPLYFVSFRRKTSPGTFTSNFISRNLMTVSPIVTEFCMRVNETITPSTGR